MAERKLKIKFNKENLSGFEKTRVIPLGGLSRIGLNILLVETEKALLAIDCGMAFPEEDLGLDKIIPDISYIKNRKEKFKGFFITHGHEDHIGALSFLFDSFRSNIYGLNLSCELIKRKRMSMGENDFTYIKTVEPNKKIKVGDIYVEFVRISHSIPDAAALVIYTPDGIIFHTGDFRVDLSATDNDSIDFSRLTKLGQENVVLMTSDSTNATKVGWTKSEKSVGDDLLSIFARNKESRIIISTFSSNIARIQNIITAAERTGRRIFIEGKSMMDMIAMAKELGYIKFHPSTISADFNQINQRNPVMIVTGSQGEPNSVLARIARNEHPKIKLKPADLIIFSSKVIPGNEISVERILNDLIKAGVKNIIKDVHTSGHARREELKLLAKIISPKYIMPVHGDYYQRYMACSAFKELGYNKDKLIFAKDGDVFEISYEIKVLGDIPAIKYYLDGRSVALSEMIEERKCLASNGCVVVVYDQSIREIKHYEFIGISIPKELTDYIWMKFLRIAEKITEEHMLKERLQEEIYAVTGKRPIISLTFFKGD